MISGENIFDLLKANVQYVVCGGIACVLHGVERATYDIDLSVKDSEEVIIDEVKIKITSLADFLFVKKLINPLRDKDILDIKELEKIYEQKNKSGKR